MSNGKPNPKTVRLTVEQLRRILRSDPDGFYRTIDTMVKTCDDEATIEFWLAVREFAKKTAD